MSAFFFSQNEVPKKKGGGVLKTEVGPFLQKGEMYFLPYRLLVGLRKNRLIRAINNVAYHRKASSTRGRKLKEQMGRVVDASRLVLCQLYVANSIEVGNFGEPIQKGEAG